MRLAEMGRCMKHELIHELRYNKNVVQSSRVLVSLGMFIKIKELRGLQEQVEPHGLWFLNVSPTNKKT